MSNIVVGKQDPKEQASNFGYVPGRGFYQRRTWKVTNPTDLPALLGQLIAAGYAYDVSPGGDGAYFVVEAKIDADPQGQGDPTTTQLSEVWERDVLLSEKDILESDLQVMQNITADEKSLIREAIQSPNGTSPALGGDATDVYLLMLNGVKSVRVYSPVIRRTRIAANSYSVQVSDTNVGRILTTAQMTSLENAPSTLLFNLPNYTIGRTDISLRYGFYKKPARVNQQGDGRWQIVQEYDYGYWSTVIYQGV